MRVKYCSRPENKYIDAKLGLGGDRGYGIRVRTSMAGKLLANERENICTILNRRGGPSRYEARCLLEPIGQKTKTGKGGGSPNPVNDGMRPKLDRVARGC